MAGKKISELTQANAVADTDLFIVETNEGTKAVPYSGFKSDGNDVSFNGTGANSIAIGNGANSGYKSVVIGSSDNESPSAAGNCSIAIGSSTTTASNINGTIANDNSVVIGSSRSTSTFARNNSVTIGSGASSYSNSVAIGNAAQSEDDSIAIGSIAIAGKKSSVIIGSGAYSYNSNSVAIGRGSGVNGNYSTALGDSSKANANYSTAIGYKASTSNANSIQLGDASNLSSITAKVSITTTSDERDKTDITEIEDSALEFLNKVKAIRYVFNGRKLYIDDENLSDEEREKLSKYGMCAYDKEAHAHGTKKGNRVRVGVSAQNIQQALIDVFGDSGYANLVNDNLFDYDPDEIPDGVESQLAVNYEGFIPFLIKAVQELDARVKELEIK